MHSFFLTIMQGLLGFEALVLQASLLVVTLLLHGPRTLYTVSTVNAR